MATKPAKAEPTNNKSARTEANRKRRLQRTLKAQPNNKQVELALGDSGTKRKAPGKREWSHSARRMAQIVKLFCGSAPKEIFTSNSKAHQDQLQTLASVKTGKPQAGRVDFSVRARAHDKAGRLVWI
jgi:hypothetical protein